MFSCFNELFNTLLLLHLIKNWYVSKAAVYGLMSALFTVIDGIIYGRIDGL
jgi:hypothetical protein